MDHNPYQTPNTNVDPNEPEPKNTLFWKVFFWFNAIVTALTLISLPFIDLLSVIDQIDLIITLIAIAGLYGYAYYRPIGRVVFWRYFFYVVLFESLLYNFYLPLSGASRYGEPTPFDAYYIVEIIFVVFMLIAMHRYAYRLPFIWQRNNKEL